LLQKEKGFSLGHPFFKLPFSVWGPSGKLAGILLSVLN